MQWKRALVSFSLTPGSYAFDSSVDDASRNTRDRPLSLIGRAEPKCLEAPMSGYCDTCGGWVNPVLNTYVKCQSPTDKTTDDQKNAYQEEHGKCRAYTPDQNARSLEEKKKCERYCAKPPNQIPEGSAPLYNGFKPAIGDPLIDNNFFYLFCDSEGRYYEPAECAYDNFLPGLIADVVLMAWLRPSSSLMTSSTSRAISSLMCYNWPPASPSRRSQEVRLSQRRGGPRRSLSRRLRRCMGTAAVTTSLARRRNPCAPERLTRSRYRKPSDR